MTDRIQLNAGQPIVGPSGTMEQAFRRWAEVMGYQQPIVGSGSPEGVIDAPQYSIYLDDTAAAGSITYRKMLPDISGDRTKGWKLG